MARRRVVVLYGGRADEHSISCISAAGVLRALDAERFEAVPLGITRSGRWLSGAADPREYELGPESLPEVEPSEGTQSVVLDMGRGGDGFFIRDADGSLTSLGHIDAVLPVLHGPFGEDGTVQGLLEMMGVPYVGCGVLASSVCMDKHFTKLLLAAAGISVAPGITVDARALWGADGVSRGAEALGGDAADALLARVRSAGLRYPLFVKPSRAGSSFGVSKVEREGDAHELAAAVAEAAGHDWKVLIEQGVQGREIECAVLEPVAGGEPSASLPGEIVLDRVDTGSDQFYDFESKYLDAQASHVAVPADLPPAVLDRVRDVAIRAFKAVDATGLSRVDTFVSSNGDVTVNEINTMPGFTPISMYPKAWQATGIGYTELITTLLEATLSQAA